MIRSLPGLLVAYFVISHATAAQAPLADVNRWWQMAELLMANKPPYKDVEMTLRRKVAEPLLLSAWQNSDALTPEVKRQVGLRLLQAWVGTNNLLKAWALASDLRRNRQLFPCDSNSSRSAPLVIAYSCAELDRLEATDAYSLHSFPSSSLPSTEIVCRGFDTPNARGPRCLETARQVFKRSEKAFNELAARVRAGVSASDAPALADLLNSALADLPATLEARESLAQQGLLLAFQEDSDTRAMLAEIQSIRATRKIEVDNTLKLNLARFHRDKNEIAEARAILKEMKNMKPQIAWLSELVAATLDVREQKKDAAADRLLKALPLRLTAQSSALAAGNPLDMERRLGGYDNSDDILISVARQSSDSVAGQRLLREYVASVVGAGDAFLRLQFASWRAHGQEDLHAVIARTVASQTSSSQLATESLALARRRETYEELAKVLSRLKNVAAPSTNAAEIWHAAWRKLAENHSELLVVMQYRPFQFNLPVPQAVGQLHYTALHFRSENSPPEFHPLGLSKNLDKQLRVLADQLKSGNNGDSILQTIGELMQIPKPDQSATSSGRLVVLGSGEFQQFPWAILPDYNRRPLLENWSIVQIGGLPEVLEWGASRGPVRNSAYLGRPDLSPLRSWLAKGPLRGLLSNLEWDATEHRNENDEIAALRKWGPVVLHSGDSATESALSHSPPPEVLHIFTHGAWLGGADVPPGDRALMLFHPDNRSDGILLASEAKMARLDGTRLAVLAVCEGGRGKTQRTNSLEGFRTAFHFAGAKAVLAPIWLVPSEETSGLLRSVYAKTADWDESLRQAQLEAHNKNKARLGWAGWILSGDPLR